MEFPTKVTLSMPWVSRNAAAACASSSTVKGSMALPLLPNPGRSGTRVWNSSASTSAVGSR